jgi:hypothetical protein
MKLPLVLALGAIAALTLAAADVAGVWKGSMETQLGDTEVVITIEPGATLTGKVQAGQYEAPIENGKLAGDRISFEINIDPGKVVYEGTVSGDEMKLNVTGTQGNKYELICKREKRARSGAPEGGLAVGDASGTRDVMTGRQGGETERRARRPLLPAPSPR